MNVHDSERISGLLDAAGYVPAQDGSTPDVVVFNTCAVRENADNRLYGNLGHLKPVKDRTPGMQIAVGGLPRAEGPGPHHDKAPWVDVVFGTHNVGSLPVLLERARVEQQAQVELHESLEVFPSTLPARRESASSAWVSISVGCDNTCTFCIVPSLRGKEEDRRPGDVLREVEVLAQQGVLEVTLLGQNVNSYGRSFGERGAFADLLRAVGAVDGHRARALHQPPPARLHRRRHRRDGRDAGGVPEPAHAAAVGLRRGAQGDAPLLPQRALPRHPRPGPRAAARTRPSPPTSSSASPARPTPTSTTRCGWSRRPASPAPSPSSTAAARHPAAALPELPKAVVSERYDRLVALQDRLSYEGMQRRSAAPSRSS
jgi:tRNA-2-methylthio-N6-dimethylallyladenosine synthase